MARCKWIAFGPVVLVLLPLSAVAQSDLISEQYLYLSGKRAVLVPGTSQTSNPDSMAQNDLELFAALDPDLRAYSNNSCMTLIVDDPATQAAKGQAKSQTPNSAYQAPDKNNQKEVDLNDVIYNETGGLRPNPKAKPGNPGSAENLHAARIAVGEVAERVLQSSHPEREQAPRTLTHETVRDLNAGNKDVVRSLNDSLSAARARSNTTNDAMHFRTGRHKFKSLYGRKGTMYFGPFVDVTGGTRYLTIAP